MTPSKTLFWLCIAFVIGIAIEFFITIPPTFVWGFLLLGGLIIFVSFLYRNNGRSSIIAVQEHRILILAFCLLFFVMGVARFQLAQFDVTNNALSKLNDKPQKVTLTGQIADGPDVRDTSRKLMVNVKHSLVLVTVARVPEYHYLDTIQITGKLKTPAVFDDFNYKNYLLKDGVYSVMDYPKVKLVSQKHQYNIVTFLYEKILFFKEQLRSSITTNFSPPQSFILEGIVLGNNKTMTQDLRDKLNGTGLRYLTAISGVHVIILSEIILSLLLALGFWRGQAFYFSISFIWLYIILTGFPASGIRAAIMGSIFLLAQKLGRQNTSGRIILLAAALMLFQNPLLLLYDIGFQLSFLASMGIIYLKPLIANAITMISHGKAKYLVNIISVTLTAQLVTVPIMVYNFGTISLIAPLTNILVVPIVYWLMLFGFLASLAGIFSNLFGFLCSLPAWVLLTYFTKVMDIFYQPWAVVTLKNVSWIWLAIYYVILLGIIMYAKKYQQPKFLEY